jgi:tetratricopeptide (TPR) repeat protein
MAPEQARGEVARVNERADVFALGSILCEILTGEPAFTGRSSGEIQRKAALGDLADALARLDSCAADAELVVLARDCLAREADDRPRDAGAVSGRLTGYLTGVQERLRRAELAHAASAARAEEAGRTAEAAVARARAEQRARRLTAGLAASVVALVGLGAGGYAWVAHQSSVRRAAETASVNEALDEAAALRGEARSDPRGDPSAWDGAVAAAKRARALLRADESNPALVGRVAAVLAALDREQTQAARRVEQAEADRRLVSQLETVRIGRADHLSLKRADAEYAAALLAHSLDADRALPAAFGAALAGRAASAEIASDLDDWASVRIMAGRPDEAWKRIVALAQAVDPDPRRAVLWGRFEAKDRAALERLADEAISTGGQPTASLVLLAWALDNLGAGERAADVLRAAWRRDPGDFWINHDLGARNRRDLVTDPLEPRRNEEMRFMTAAVALRPASPAAHERLGSLLWFEFRKTKEAASEFREAIRLKPDYAHAWHLLAFCLEDLGQRREAIAAWREAVRLAPAHGQYRFWLGRYLLLVGEFQEAAENLRRGTDLGFHDRANTLARAEMFIALQKRLPAVLRGDERPSPSERINFARLCYGLSLYASATRFCAQAYAEEPTLGDDLDRGRRYFCAIPSAARAGAGEGRDDPAPDEAERASLRKQALTWLRQEIARWEKALATGSPAARKVAREQLTEIQVGEPSLAFYRDPARLATLPAAEQAEWRAFWADAASFLQKIKEGAIPK